MSMERCFSVRKNGTPACVYQQLGEKKRCPHGGGTEEVEVRQEGVFWVVSSQKYREVLSGHAWLV